MKDHVPFSPSRAKNSIEKSLPPSRKWWFTRIALCCRKSERPVRLYRLHKSHLFRVMLPSPHGTMSRLVWKPPIVGSPYLTSNDQEPHSLIEIAAANDTFLVSFQLANNIVLPKIKNDIGALGMFFDEMNNKIPISFKLHKIWKTVDKAAWSCTKIQLKKFWYRTRLRRNLTIRRRR